MTGEDRYVVVKGRFGMGGRIAVVLSALRYARATHRQLVVDWNDPAYYRAGVEDVFRGYFAAPATAPVTMDVLASASVFPRMWQDKLLWYRNVVDGEIMPYELSFCEPPVPEQPIEDQVVVVTRNIAKKQLAPLYAELVLAAPLASAVDHFAAAHFVRPPIGVHVRHGNGEHLLTPPDTRWFHDQIAPLLAAQPDRPVFLATDSPDVTEEFQVRYPRLVTTSKWLPAPGTGSLHQNPACPDRFQNGAEVLLDMWLLSKCPDLRLSPGFVGTTARYLRRGWHDSIEVYPERIHPTREQKAGWDNPI